MLSKLNTSKLESGAGATQSVYNVPYVDPILRVYNSGLDAFSDLFGNAYDFLTNNIVKEKLDNTGLLDNLNSAQTDSIESEEKPADHAAMTNERITIFVLAGIFVIFAVRKFV